MATTPGYDPKKAALFNQLRQGGLSEDAAAAQARIEPGQIRLSNLLTRLLNNNLGTRVKSYN